jgi:hypothetical protein
MKMRHLLPSMIFVLIASVAFCDTYTWEDQNGINFTDDLAKVPLNYRRKAISEAREDISGSRPPVTTLEQSRSNEPAFPQPNSDLSNQDDKISDSNNFRQEQPPNLDKANTEIMYQDSYQSQGGYYNQRHKRGQTHGVHKAQRSANESLSPARKAMNRAEERIRQSRQALDAGGHSPSGQEQDKSHKSQERKNQ